VCCKFDVVACHHYVSVSNYCVCVGVCCKFDVVACHYAFHYACAKSETARQLLANAAALVESGGIFLATIIDYRVLKSKVRAALLHSSSPPSSNTERVGLNTGEDNNKDEEGLVTGDGDDAAAAAAAAASDAPHAHQSVCAGNDVFQVNFSRDNAMRLLNLDEPQPVNLHESAPSTITPQNGFGIAYNFSLGDAVDDCPEYVVPLPEVCLMAEEVGFEVLWAQNCGDMVLECCEHPFWGPMLSTMHVTPSQGTNHHHQNRALSQPEWEVAGLYAGVVFRKKVVI